MNTTSATNIYDPPPEKRYLWYVYVKDENNVDIDYEVALTRAICTRFVNRFKRKYPLPFRIRVQAHYLQVLNKTDVTAQFIK